MLPSDNSGGRVPRARVIPVSADGARNSAVGETLPCYRNDINRRRRFLAKGLDGLHPKVRLQFAPAYSPWLIHVELRFSTIDRGLLARGIFTSVSDLARGIRTYMRHYGKRAKPIRWNYRKPAHRPGSSSTQTVP